MAAGLLRVVITVLGISILEFLLLLLFQPRLLPGFFLWISVLDPKAGLLADEIVALLFTLIVWVLVAHAVEFWVALVELVLSEVVEAVADVECGLLQHGL